jgi:glycosyltransferase involved in cell wall biosynthesis
VSECRVKTGWKVFRRYPALLWKALRSGAGKAVLFVPDFGHKDVPLAWLLTRLAGGVCVFDPLVSRYETKVLDRGDASEGSPQSWHNRNIDRVSFRLPDLVLADTDAHGRFFSDLYGNAPGAIRTVHIGYDDEFFSERPDRGEDGTLRVLFYGTYLPLHGVETIVDAARLLAEEPISLTLVGGGQRYESVRERAAGIPPGRCTFAAAVPQRELVDRIAAADVVLGVFGETVKARLVIPNKVYQALSVGRAVVTADTPAIRELFTDGEHLLTVPPGDAAALARTLVRLLRDVDLRRRIAAQGGRLVRTAYGPPSVAARFLEILGEEVQP